MEYIKEFIENAYFHCLHYVVKRRLQRLEKIFWTLCVVLSMIGAIFVVQISVDTFYSTRASIRVRTDYLDFTTPFPAVFFCEEKEIKGKFENLLQQLKFNVSTDRQSAFDIENFVRATTFIRPLESSISQKVCDDPQKDYCRFTTTFGGNLSVFLKHIRASCQEIFTSCTFNGVEFDCCDNFLPVDSYEGKCYAINSYNAIIENNGLKNFLTVQYNNFKEDEQANSIKTLLGKFKTFNVKHSPDTNPANLSVELAHTDLSIWYMGNTNIPTKMYQKQNHLHERRFRAFRTADIYLRVLVVTPENSLLNLEIKRRNCRLPQEKKDIKSFKAYTNSACEIECLKKAQLRFCGCYVHLLPSQNGLKDKQCNISGLNCVSEQSQIGSYLTNCKCLSNCLLFDVSLIGIVRNFEYDKNIRLRSNQSKKRVNFITRAPTVQYVRHAHQEFLAFIVSIGGAISLFIGCSCLTLAQIFYYFILKPFGERYLTKQK